MEPTKKALCIDDDAVNRMVMKHLLQPLGFQVDLAADGFQAIDLVHHSTYDLILLDIMMPGKDGFETANELREQEHVDAPIIFVSAYSPEELQQNMERNNIQYFISKPIDKDSLYQILDKALHN
ncbi:MAG: autoinducer 2 sensor kinase/phosphatase LuxQ [Bacteroidota bacterium]|jgi:two-component system autoinducer 1 sensor kinase/phosphatase LuxN